MSDVINGMMFAVKCAEMSCVMRDACCDVWCDIWCDV